MTDESEYEELEESLECVIEFLLDELHDRDYPKYTEEDQKDIRSTVKYLTTLHYANFGWKNSETT